MSDCYKMELLYIFEISKISGIHNIVAKNLPDIYAQFTDISKAYRYTKTHYKPQLCLFGWVKNRNYYVTINLNLDKQTMRQCTSYCSWNTIITLYRDLEAVKSLQNA